MDDQTTSIESMKKRVHDFVHARNWERYHNPKDIAESITIEAAELLEIFQWMKPDESEQLISKPETMQRVREEVADVIIYCLSLANSLKIDLANAILWKLEQDERKYPSGV